MKTEYFVCVINSNFAKKIIYEFVFLSNPALNFDQNGIINVKLKSKMLRNSKYNV